MNYDISTLIVNELFTMNLRNGWSKIKSKVNRLSPSFQAVSQSGSTVTVGEKSGSCGAGQNTSLAGTGGAKYTMTPYGR